MNHGRCVWRPRTPRSIGIDELAKERPGISEHAARRAALRILVSMRARHARLCGLPGASEAFERLMLAMGNETSEA